MVLNDESHVFPDPSGDLISRHCAEARERIQLAGDKEEALRVKREICARLAGQCASGLVVQATTSYVDQLIEERWSSR